jgi:hypothetical protein
MPQVLPQTLNLWVSSGLQCGLDMRLFLPTLEEIHQAVQKKDFPVARHQ